jgi:carbamate kinase
VEASTLLILTDVKKVQRGFGSLYPEEIERMPADEAAELLKAGEFGTGSMGPKIQAAIDFLEAGGKRVMIGDLDEAPAILRGEAGTTIVPS